ncbi:hypothetical protein FRB90_008755, partial [Tulasnella sp. 427]
MSSLELPSHPNTDSDHSDVDHEAAEAMRTVWTALHTNTPSSSKSVPRQTHAEPSDVSPAPPRERPVCRLVVISSGILPKGRTHAVIEPHDAVKVGRDKQPEALLRLKELAVSKHHASIFWDEGRAEWAIVDLGSVHGTWVASGEEEGQRLSTPRAASLPRRLVHGDTLTIGSSEFSVHVHESGRPCEECEVGPANTIPLLPESAEKEGPSSSRTTSASSSTSAASSSSRPRVSHKAAMQSLRQTLLRPGGRAAPLQEEPLPHSTGSAYNDRARKRREMFGTEGRDADATSSRPSHHPAQREKRPRYDDPRVSTVLGSETPSDELVASSAGIQSRPIDESNIGHRLLMKKGWTPGEALGINDDAGTRRALLEPLQVVKREGQSGI